MRARRNACVVAMVLLCAGCMPSPEKLEGMVPDGPRLAGRAVLESIRSGDLAALESTLHSLMNVDELRQSLAPWIAAIAASPSFEAEFGAWQWVYRDSVGQHEMTYEIATADDRYLVALAFREESGAPRLAGIHYKHLESSLIDANRFALEGKSPTHYFFLAAGVAFPILCLVTLIACWRRRPAHRWLWILFIIVAFPVATLNWTTGDVSLNPLAFNLFGAGFNQRGVLEPMFLQLGGPIGALVFWLGKPGRRSNGKATSEPVSPAA